MPLKASEVIELRDEIIDLYEELGKALIPDPDGKRRIDRTERKRIVKLAMELAAKLVLEALD